MFEYFTFGSPIRAEEHSSYELGPCDTFTMPDSPSLSVPHAEPMILSDEHWESDSFDDKQTSRWALPSPPSEAEFDFADKLEHCLRVESCEDASRHSPIRSPNPDCRRVQRQRNSQLLCTSAHTKTIGTMIEDMVVNGTQCNILARAPKPTTTVLPTIRTNNQTIIVDDSMQPFAEEELDEGFFEGNEDARDRSLERIMFSLRDAASPTGINKKYENPLKVRRAGDWDGNGTQAGPPRVRKRITQRKMSRRVAAAAATAATAATSSS